jgi:hypothetical protein
VILYEYFQSFLRESGRLTAGLCINREGGKEKKKTTITTHNNATTTQQKRPHNNKQG